jgi:hypothetical protein
MPDHFLLPTQRNAVFETIKEAGLDPSEFTWGTIRTRASAAHNFDVPILMHEPSDSSFTFDFNAYTQEHIAYHTPGRDKPEEGWRCSGWNNELTYVRWWLGLVKREYEAPDLWGELGKQRELMGGELALVGNAPFTPDEQRQIEAQLQETKAFVRKSFELTEAQYGAIEARLDYLVEASGRMGRVDWRTAFAGVFLTAIVMGMLPSDVVREVMEIALRGLAGLFGVDIPALPS